MKIAVNNLKKYYEKLIKFAICFLEKETAENRKIAKSNYFAAVNVQIDESGITGFNSCELRSSLGNDTAGKTFFRRKIC